MKIIFFGTSEFALPALEALKKAGLAPAIVVTAEDNPSGRGMKISSPPVKELVKDWWLTVKQPEKIDDELIKELANIDPDIGVVAAYGKILPKSLIEIFPKGILNIHPSLLPKYRGASPIENTILAGEENNTGVSIILLDEKMDHGPIVTQKNLPKPLLGKEGQGVVGYTNLHNALAALGADMLVEVIPKWVEGKIEPKEQDDSQVTFTKLIKKEDGKIDWAQSAEYIERMTRAYEKWPGTFTYLPNPLLGKEGQGVVKIIKGEVIERHLTMEPGKIFESNGFPAVACGERALKLLIVQPEGKNAMPGDAYLRGHREILQ